MSGGFQGPAESTARAPLTCSHLFIVYEHGRPEAAGRPLDQVRRLLRTHVDQHTLGYQERRQPGGERAAREPPAAGAPGEHVRCWAGASGPGGQERHTNTASRHVTQV